jgi:hypothetical protein
MNSIDKISKEALNLLTYSKDVVTNNLATANATGALEPKLTEEQIRNVLSLVDHSLSQGFQKGLTSFQKTVKGELKASSSLESKKKK